MNKIIIYTDGSCRNTIGAYGCIILIDNQKYVLTNTEENTTNNRMELFAVLYSLDNNIINKYKNSEIIIYTDSQYVQKGYVEWLDNWIKNNWINSNKKDVKNRDLWEKFIELRSKHQYFNNQIVLKWVRGHNGDRYNEEIDKLVQNLTLKK